jgi:CRISPR-associated protein Csx10
MSRIIVSLQAESPVAIRDSRATDRATTLPYIPGSVLLGGLAETHAALHPQQADRFAEFFTRGRVRYGNAYPASFTQTLRALQDELSPVRPLPSTARSCKRFPGFRFQRDDDHEYHGVTDHLLPWVVFAISGETSIEALELMATCRECHGSVAAFAGFYRRGEGEGAIGRSDQDTILLTRTGLSRETGTVYQSIIYSREALPRKTRFWAEFSVDGDILRDFQSFLEEAGSSGLLRVGTSRTRGLGRLAVLSCYVADGLADTEEGIHARVQEWNRQLKQAASEAGVDLKGASYVPITLLSDALVLDPLLRWRLRLDSDVLAAVGLPGATLTYQAATTRRVSGWNGLMRLPREDALAIGMGSVFLLSFDREPDTAALLALQEHGIGERIDEGFGRIAVADPFHWEVRNA